MRILLLPLFFLFVAPLLVAQEPDSSRPTVLAPIPLAPGKSHWSMGISVATFPRLLVEEEINQFPLAESRVVVGIPWGLTATAHLSTNFYVVNHLSVGLRFPAEFGSFSAALGSEIAYWFGAFVQSGFDNTVRGSMAYPYVTASLDAGDIRITARAELQFLLVDEQFAGNIEVSYNRDRFSGAAFGLYLEQPLWKNQHVMFGAKITSTDSFYQAWVAFNTLRRRQLYTELFFAFLIH